MKLTRSRSTVHFPKIRKFQYSVMTKPCIRKEIECSYCACAEREVGFCVLRAPAILESAPAACKAFCVPWACLSRRARLRETVGESQLQHVSSLHDLRQHRASERSPRVRCSERLVRVARRRQESWICYRKCIRSPCGAGVTWPNALAGAIPSIRQLTRLFENKMCSNHSNEGAHCF